MKKTTKLKIPPLLIVLFHKGIISQSGLEESARCVQEGNERGLKKVLDDVIVYFPEVPQIREIQKILQEEKNET